MALYQIGATPLQVVWGAAAADRRKAVGHYLIVNRDETQQILIASDFSGYGEPDLITPDNRAVTIIDPLGSTAVSSGLNWWAVSPSGATVTVGVTEDGSYWAPSPAQVAEQISALGLALQSTQLEVQGNTGTTASNVSAVQATLGSPAQDASVQAVKTTLGTPAQDGTVSGVTSAVNSPSYGPPTHTDVVTSLPANIATSGVARDSTVAGITGTLNAGIALPIDAAKDSSVTGVTAAVNSPAFGPAKDSSLTSINTTLGTPAQSADVTATLPANIAASGVPLLALSTNVLDKSALSFVTNGPAQSFGLSTFTQISYECGFTIAAQTGETNGNLRINFEWSDAATGLIVDRESWIICSGTGTTTNTYAGTGRAKGNRLKVTLTWSGTTTATVSVVVNQTSRVYVRDDLRTTETFNGQSGFTSATYDLDGGCIISTVPTIGANSSQTRAMPLYHGMAQLCVSSPSEACTVTIENTAETAVAALTQNSIFASNVAANANLNALISLPRSPCSLVINNNGSASGVFNVQILTAEQEN